VYYVTLLLVAASAAFFMAPTAFHRLTFRRGQKPYLIGLGTRFAIVGLALLALAMIGVLMLLADILFHAATVIVVVAGAVGLFGWLWFGLAWTRLASGRREW